VVQHGSLLWSANMAVAEPARHAGVADVARAAGVALAADDIVDTWLTGIAAAGRLRLEMQSGCTWDQAGSVITELAGRFRDPGWTERR